MILLFTIIDKNIPFFLFLFLTQEKSKKAAKTKKETRRQRRKPKNLFEEYKNRQDKFKWLETHIWHAKRFYVKENWGYKIARNTFAKALRASYRAAKSHCLLQVIIILFF